MTPLLPFYGFKTASGQGQPGWFTIKGHRSTTKSARISKTNKIADKSKTSYENDKYGNALNSINSAKFGKSVRFKKSVNFFFWELLVKFLTVIFLI